MIVHSFLRNAQGFSTVETPTEPDPVYNNYSKLTVSNSITSAPSLIAWHPSGNYLAVTGSSSKNCYIYKKNVDSFALLTTLTCSCSPRSCEWDSTGYFLAMNGTISPYTQIFSQIDDTFTLLDNPLTPAPTSYCSLSTVSFDPSSQYFICGWYNTLQAYKNVNHTFTNLSTISSLPTYRTIFAWTPDSKYLVAAHPDSYGFKLYSKSGDTISFLTTVGGAGRYCQRAAFSYDGKFLFTVNGGSNAYKFNVYTFNNGTLTRISTGTYSSVVGAYSLSISKNNYDVILASSTAPLGYKFNPDTYAITPFSSNPFTGISGMLSDTKFDSSGRYLAIAYNTAPYLQIYKLS